MHRPYRLALVALAGLFGIAAAPPGPVVIAGGALDPGYTGADVYLADPPPPAVPPGPACAAAKAYVAAIAAGRFADVPVLFADDAALLEPTHLGIRGRDAITRFYTKAIGTMRPDLAAVFYTGDATDCLVELAVRQPIDGRPRFRLASMDHFTVDARGKVIRMVAFGRTGNVGLAPPRLDK